VAVHTILTTEPDELARVGVVTVDEPGKSRTVTKPMTAIKILFDVVAKVCSRVLKRAFPSSHSGMAQADHPWRLSQKMYTERYKSEVFSLSSHDMKAQAGDVLELLRIFEACFLASTDYEEATDYMHHRIGECMGTWWMRICGIPRLWRSLVVRFSYRPRVAVFTANGPFKLIGSPTN
jgi:hypothetical protein